MTGRMIPHKYRVDQCSCGSTHFDRIDRRIHCVECDTVPKELPPPPHPTGHIILSVYGTHGREEGRVYRNDIYANKTDKEHNEEEP